MILLSLRAETEAAVVWSSDKHRGSAVSWFLKTSEDFIQRWNEARKLRLCRGIWSPKFASCFKRYYSEEDRSSLHIQGLGFI
jgi:hypothetical protein